MVFVPAWQPEADVLYSSVAVPKVEPDSPPDLLFVSGSGFARRQRLLTASDFQGVFRQARYKVSSRTLLVLAIENGTARARLGLVVGKKHLKQAVQRNRVKRLIRESFRHHQQSLSGLDIVVLVRGNLSSEDSARIRQSIDTLWHDLIRRRSRSQSTESNSDAE